MRKQKNRFNFIVGLILVSFALLLVIIGIFYTPYDPNEMNVLAKNQAPSLSHLFGTDYMGRDVLSRVMEGAFTTFFVGIATVFIGATVGSILGAVTGYFGGVVDANQ